MGLDHLALLGGERVVELRAEQRNQQGGRDVELPEFAGEHEGAVALDQRAAVGESPHGFDRIQRDPLGVGDDPPLAVTGSVATESSRSIALSPRFEAHVLGDARRPARSSGRCSDSSGRAKA